MQKYIPRRNWSNTPIGSLHPELQIVRTSSIVKPFAIQYTYTAFLFFVSVLFFSCGETNQQQAASETTKQEETTPQPVKIAQPMIDTSIKLNYLMGQFSPNKHPDFVKIGMPFAENKGMVLRKEVYEAFKKMHAAAKKDGINLLIRSATRNFDRQKVIWEGKWNGTRKLEGGTNAKTAFPDPEKRALEILKWSSMPGSSRHHWGTDIDLNAFVNSYFEKGKGKKEYEWLQANASSYGFCQPYSPKGAERPYGYNEEKWHWTYMPLSQALTQQCELRLKDSMITGFDGAEVAPKIGIVEKYVLGINKSCR